MKSKLFSLLCLTLFSVVWWAGPVPAHADKIHVVATLTDLADLARNIGGDQVEVQSLATGIEDTHGVPMKPSFVPMMNRADLLLEVGLGCEHAFLPALQEASKNPRIQEGKPGCVDCSVGIIPKDVPKSTDHTAGDVHAYGNPHYMLDPVLAKTAIANIYRALVAFAPQSQAEFTRNRDAYLAKLNAKIAEWRQEIQPAKGVKFVSYHEHWPYFADRFGLKYIGTIELRPGIDPTPRHIEELINTMRAEHASIVVREPQFPAKVPTLIASQTGATLVVLPIMPGGVPDTGTYIKMMDYIVHTMVSAAQAKK
ncbi:MAG TPA: metal ABC transporter substrate-binding protein [Terriglobia bacterium]|nr:metal ABC transporter substrate-binding protein [Terriglobia bacterium]